MMLVLLCFSCEKEEKYAVITVTTSVSDITESSAMIRGAVNIEKGKDSDDINIVGKGLYYRKQGNKWDKFEMGLNEDFSLYYYNLMLLTTYEVQAYAEIGDNEVRGNIVTFTTKVEATTAQVRFKKTAVSFFTIITVDSDGGDELTRHEFGTGTGISSYNEIPAGDHFIWFYDYYNDEWIKSELKTFQTGHKYTITIDENSYSNYTYYFDDDGIFPSSALKSSTTITVSKKSLKDQKGMVRAITDKKLLP